MEFEHQEFTDSEPVDKAETLIKQIQKYEFIYNLAHKDYKNVIKKEAAWKDIATDLKFPIEDCKKLWKYLRDKYTREKRDGRKPGSETEHRWSLYSKMKFFNEYTRPRKFIRKRSTTVKVQRPETTSFLSSPTLPWVATDRVLIPPETAPESPTSQPGRSDDTTVPAPVPTITVLAEKFKMETTNDAGIEMQQKNEKEVTKPIRETLSQNRTFVEHVFAVLEDLSPEEAKEKRRHIITVLYD